MYRFGLYLFHRPSASFAIVFAFLLSLPPANAEVLVETSSVGKCWSAWSRIEQDVLLSAGLSKYTAVSPYVQGLVDKIIADQSVRSRQISISLVDSVLELGLSFIEDHLQFYRRKLESGGFEGTSALPGLNELVAQMRSKKLTELAGLRAIRLLRNQFRTQFAHDENPERAFDFLHSWRMGPFQSWLEATLLRVKGLSMRRKNLVSEKELTRWLTRFLMAAGSGSEPESVTFPQNYQIYGQYSHFRSFVQEAAGPFLNLPVLRFPNFGEMVWLFVNGANPIYVTLDRQVPYDLDFRDARDTGHGPDRVAGHDYFHGAAIAETASRWEGDFESYIAFHRDAYLKTLSTFATKDFQRFADLSVLLWFNAIHELGRDFRTPTLDWMSSKESFELNLRETIKREKDYPTSVRRQAEIILRDLTSGVSPTSEFSDGWKVLAAFREVRAAIRPEDY